MKNFIAEEVMKEFHAARVPVSIMKNGSDMQDYPQVLHLRYYWVKGVLNTSTPHG